MRKILSGFAFFLAGLLVAIGITSRSEGVRLEGAAGHCRHRLAPDASWSYREWGNYQTSMELNPACYQIGLSYLPLELYGVKFGIRGAFVNLGRVTADNTFPTDEKEYFRAKETRTAVQSDTGRFQGYGTSKGFTLGLAAERRRYGLDFGAEAGIALLRNTWHVNLPGFGSAVLNGCRDDWACADCLNGTWYVGVNARYQYLFVSIRRYANVHASQAGRNPLFVGPTDGPVTQITAGISFPL